jgi:hypothetical protein
VHETACSGSDLAIPFRNHPLFLSSSTFVIGSSGKPNRLTRTKKCILVAFVAMWRNGIILTILSCGKVHGILVSVEKTFFQVRLFQFSLGRSDTHHSAVITDHDHVLHFVV